MSVFTPLSPEQWELLNQASGGRYLTNVEKERELAEWEATKARMPVPPPHSGGRGYPDPAVFDLVDQLNSLEGVCTLQSCCGHSPEDSGGGWYPGNLWLRFGGRQAYRFEVEMASALARHPLIERVGKHWREDGAEVVEITFHGAERNRLAESSELIYATLSGLAHWYYAGRTPSGGPTPA